MFDCAALTTCKLFSDTSWCDCCCIIPPWWLLCTLGGNTVAVAVTCGPLFHLIVSTLAIVVFVVAGLPMGMNTFCRLPTTVTGLCAVMFMGDDPGLMGEYDGVPDRELPNETEMEERGTRINIRNRNCDTKKLNYLNSACTTRRPFGSQGNSLWGFAAPKTEQEKKN